MKQSILFSPACGGFGASEPTTQVVGYFCSIALISLFSGCATAPPHSSDPQLRDRALRYIHSAMKFEETPAVRAQAIEAAESVGDELKNEIRDGLKDKHAGVRFATCLVLGRLRDASSLPAIRSLLNDPDPNVKVSAYFALERLGDASHRPEWAQAFRQHEDPTVRRNAALAMGQLGDKALIPILNVAVTSDNDEGVRLQAWEALAFLGDRAAIARFVHDAYGGVGFKQPFALLTLGHVQDDRVLPTLRSRLVGAPYLEARLAAARSLAMHGHPDGFDLAVESLNWNEPRTGDPNDPPDVQVMRVRTMAALALGEIGDRRALGPLQQRMEMRDDARVQLAASKAILMIVKETSAAVATR